MNQPNQKRLQRTLKTRHLTMIALGGSIGTGLFLASGGAIAKAGPGGALIAYIAVGTMVYFLMTSLGELATYMPDSGSFSTYASRFVDPAFGFALGWNFWFNWAITIASELVAATIIMKYWFPNSNSFLWSFLFLIFIFLLNFLSTKGYGESEYWFAIIKVTTIIVFFIVGILMIIGILGNERIDFHNFYIDDAPFHGGFFTIFGVFIVAGYSFQGTELIGVAAGESKNPRESVPRSIRQVFWRIFLFYVLTIFIIALIIPYTHPSLLVSNLNDIHVSPFTLVFEKAGFVFAAAFMNAVILSSVLSAGNSGMYASTRILWKLAQDGKAPKFLAKLNKRGLPINALLITTVIGMLAFFVCFFGDRIVYLWLLNISGMCGFFTWFGIAISHYRFRRAFLQQGHDLQKLPYRARFFPLGPMFSLTFCIIVIVGEYYQAFLNYSIDWKNSFLTYIELPIFLMIYLGYKWKYRTKVIPLQKCKFDNFE
ncbi:amino acid permease [Paenibacillus popilliae]|uniref:Amino acid transporter n=1 Tax=Paenibacillus popilliae ATCC 14706 TaxID=1212764 RepID=M9LQT2_PAEPP|nr:amino acid transporter [Paenibacillus popilliae ATCC 14706]